MAKDPENNGKITANPYQEKPGGTFKEGNPGRPVGSTNKKKFIEELEEMLDEMAEGKDYTYRVALMKQVLRRMIIDGDTSLLKEYWQQRDGKPKQPIVGGDENDKPIAILSQIKSVGSTDVSGGYGL